MCAPKDRSVNYYQPMYQRSREFTFSCSIEDEWDPDTRRAVLRLENTANASVYEINSSYSLSNEQFGAVTVALS